VNNKTVPQIDPSLLFNSLSVPYIVFGANDPEFTVLAENDVHAKVAMVKQSNVIGKPLLEAFPDTSEEYKQTGKSELLESIRKVIKTGKPDNMPDLSYDLKNAKGVLTEKYWSVTHYPLRDDQGKIVAVFQETRDMTDERSIERKLSTVEHQLDQVLATSLIGTWSWDIKREKVHTDSNLATMFGINPKAASEGLPLTTFLDSIHPDDRKAVTIEIDKAIKTRAGYESEYRTIAQGKQIRWVLARGYVESDKNGKPVKFNGIIVDITDRKKAEQALTESETRLQFMADSMPQLVWVTRPDGYHEYYNRQWYEFTGTKPGETDGEGWKQLFHPDDQARAEKLWRHSLKTGELYELEYRLYHAPSKSYRWVIGRAQPLRDKTGTITKWYGTCTDIDSQKRAEQIQAFLAMASKELSSTLNYTKMLKKISELSIPAIADWCSIDLYNKETHAIEQVSIAHIDEKKISMVEEYRKYNPTDMDSPTGVPAVIRTGKTEFYPVITNEMLDEAVADKETLDFMKTLNIHSIIIAPLAINGETCGGISFTSSDSGRYYTEQDLHMAEELAARISLAMTNSQLYMASKRELKARRQLEKELLLEKDKLELRVTERTKQLQQTNAGLHEEITKRQAIEEELHEYSQNLARSNQELEDFAYVASHDLQEPLRKIQAFGNLLESEYADKLNTEGADYLRRMRSAASRMSTLIEDLLSFSRVTTRKNPSARVNLDTIINEVVGDLETRIQDVDGIVTIGPMPSVTADPTHMRQLFQNLIANALKFHQPGTQPVITVTSKSDEDMIEIRVSDNGIGFDEKYLDRIFSVFQRLHDRKTYEGTGIGLAVCRKIVERYNGTITAESKKNKGSTFIIRLPKVTKESKV
jgi:PAS domain S-box-containing protein